MSSNSGSISGIAYQSIIIALIAGGILTIGVVSILWRRRNSFRWERDPFDPLGLAAAGLDLRDDDFTGTGERRGRRGRRKGVGKVPEFWDVLVGRRLGSEEVQGLKGSRGGAIYKDEDESENEVENEVEKDKAQSGKARTEAMGEVEMDGGQGDVKDEIDLQGSMEQGWHPTSICLLETITWQAPPHPALHYAKLPHPPLPTQTDYLAEMTVLIAMPEPDKPVFASSSSFAPPLSSTSIDPTGSEPSASARQHTRSRDLAYPAVYSQPPLPTGHDPEEEPLPYLEIGTTISPISLTELGIEQEKAERVDMKVWMEQMQALRAEEAGSGSGSGSGRRDGQRRAGDRGRVRAGAAESNTDNGDTTTSNNEGGGGSTGLEDGGWASRGGLIGVIRRGDMIARPRTPPQETGSGSGSGNRDNRRWGRSRLSVSGNGNGNGGAPDVDTSDPRNRPNLFRLASMSHSMGVFRFGTGAGLSNLSGAGTGNGNGNGYGNGNRTAGQGGSYQGAGSRL